VLAWGYGCPQRESTDVDNTPDALPPGNEKAKMIPEKEDLQLAKYSLPW